MKKTVKNTTIIIVYLLWFAIVQYIILDFFNIGISEIINRINNLEEPGGFGLLLFVPGFLIVIIIPLMYILEITEKLDS